MNEEIKSGLLEEIRQLVRTQIDVERELTDEDIRDLITASVFEKSKQFYINISDKQELIAALFNSIRRLDVLQPLVDDKSITEIMVNSPSDIFIERKGKVSKINISFDNKDKLEDVIQAIVSRVNRVVNESSPIVDARLQDGSRVNVVLPPIALNGPTLTIRKFPDKPLTMDQLIKIGSISEEAADVLQRMVKAKYNIFISGGTGSGKTTFLNTLSNFIPPDERIITIEDSAELQITGIENNVRLETRNANTEGRGEITIRELIKTSLRMRPERIIVGEVRGAEALDMLQAMNTGHDGSLSTGHANSSKDMLGRLETMVLCGAQLPVEAIRQQIASAIDVIIHLSRIRDKSRRVMQIVEVEGYADGEIKLNPLFLFEEEQVIGDRVKGKLRRTENPMRNISKFMTAGIASEM